MTSVAERPNKWVKQTRPDYVRPEAETPFPAWPVTAMIAFHPLWFLLGLSGFTWVIFSIPMAIVLTSKRDLVLPKGFGLLLLFFVAVTGSVISIDEIPRLSGWVLRYGYYFGALVFLVYLLNGGKGLSVWSIIRSFTMLWMATVGGGFLAFVVGTLSFRSPMGYLMPAALVENELIKTLVTPSFADIQDIVGFPVPRPKAPFPYTNSWGSMLAILTPFGMISLNEERVGLSRRLIKIALAASIIPAVISLNRGLWLSLGVGLIYVALRLGVAGGSRAIRTSMIVGSLLAAVFFITPLGDLIETRISSGHSNEDRTELAFDAVRGAMERPLTGWGGPRPNDRNIPPVGTHGQLWFTIFSYGFVGAFGYLGALITMAWHTRKQPTTAGIWAHSVIIIGMVQMPYYLHVPYQMFAMLGAAAVALRLKNDDLI